MPLDKLGDVTVEQALKHPTWNMGPKITIDSATMMNKALEVIELHHLFDIPYDNIRVLIHPQSIIHSLVDFVDGSTKAQMGYPDMKVPISIVLGYPERLFTHPPQLDLAGVGSLDFQHPDPVRYPALALGFEAGRTGKTFPAVLNAANEVAVGLFLDGRIGFDLIVPTVEEVLSSHEGVKVDSLETLFEVDAWARREAEAVATGQPTGSRN